MWGVGVGEMLKNEGWRKNIMNLFGGKGGSAYLCLAIVKTHRAHQVVETVTFGP